MLCRRDNPSTARLGPHPRAPVREGMKPNGAAVTGDTTGKLARSFLPQHHTPLAPASENALFLTCQGVPGHRGLGVPSTCSPASSPRHTLAPGRRIVLGGAFPPSSQHDSGHVGSHREASTFPPASFAPLPNPSPPGQSSPARQVVTAPGLGGTGRGHRCPEIARPSQTHFWPQRPRRSALDLRFPETSPEPGAWTPQG